ncbi:hypothetical protein HOO65_030456 [Ceratocystis lukuohia]|uniref:Uncharacterized protein n=1 Tax=Ceratocystis lukuohia TaxID=2019550 RepID=A0ABR4MKY4_9PEZI
MILHNLLAIVMSSWMRGRGPSLNNDIQPTEVAGLDPTNTATFAEVSETAIGTRATDPADASYLLDHEYVALEKKHGGVFIQTRRFSWSSNEPVLQFYIDNVQVNDMRWIVMDVEYPSVHTTLRSYRRRNGLEYNEEIVVTPDQSGWGVFREICYYGYASHMAPGAQIDKIIVRRREREIYNGKYPAAIAEVMIFSLKKSLPDNESSSIDSIDAHAAELADEENLNDAMEDADDALEIESKDIFGMTLEQKAEETLGAMSSNLEKLKQGDSRPGGEETDSEASSEDSDLEDSS